MAILHLFVFFRNFRQLAVIFQLKIAYEDYAEKPSSPQMLLQYIFLW